MNYKYIILFILSFLLFSCEKSYNNKSKKIDLNFEKKYINSGFALIYNENLKGIKKLENRSLNIYHKSLKRKSKGTKKNGIVESMLPEIREMAKADREKERLENEYQVIKLRLKQLNSELTKGEKKILLKLSMPNPPRTKIRIGKTKKGGKKKRHRKRNRKTKKNN